MVYKLWTHAAALLPRQCLLCRSSLKQQPGNNICLHCEDALQHNYRYCRQCATPMPLSVDHCGQCIKQPPIVDQTLAPLLYNSNSLGLVAQIKRSHVGALSWAKEHLIEQLPQLNDPSFDAITAVPMHYRRHGQRGNNPSYLLAQDFATAAQQRFDGNVLQCIRPTHSQKGLDAKQRQRNVKGAFVCQQDIQGRHIAVVDDVITTGSTINEVAKTLKQAGARKVTAIAVARTPFRL